MLLKKIPTLTIAGRHKDDVEDSEVPVGAGMIILLVIHMELVWYLTHQSSDT